MDPNTDTSYGPVCRLFRLERDDDMRVLVTSGLIWRGGPKTQSRAVTWLIEHPEVPLNRVPEHIAAYITAARP